MAKRFITRVELDDATRRRLTDISHANGMTQVSLLSKIVNWFSGQPEIIQAGVLDRYPAELQPDIAKLILERMAKPAALNGVVKNGSAKSVSAVHQKGPKNKTIKL